MQQVYYHYTLQHQHENLLTFAKQSLGIESTLACCNLDMNIGVLKIISLFGTSLSIKVFLAKGD
jgi:hypothetical protein